MNTNRSRVQLNEEAVNGLEPKLEQSRYEYELLYKQERSKTGGREHLRQKVEEINANLRRERRQHWKDTQNL